MSVFSKAGKVAGKAVTAPLSKASNKISSAAREWAERGRCQARTRKNGTMVCSRRIETGRGANGVTCKQVECKLWHMSHDEEATAKFLEISVDELRERVNAAINAK